MPKKYPWQRWPDKKKGDKKDAYSGQKGDPSWKESSIQDVKDESKGASKLNFGKLKAKAKKRFEGVKKGAKKRFREAKRTRREEKKFRKQLRAAEKEAYRETLLEESKIVAKAKAKAKAHQKPVLKRLGTAISKEIKALAKTRPKARTRRTRRRSSQEEKWIAPAIKKKGALRSTVLRRFGNKGFTQRGTIKVSVLNKLSKEKGVTGQRARLAKTLRKL